MKTQPTTFDVILELALAELPAEYHSTFRQALFWDCLMHAPDELTRPCPSEFQDYLRATNTGREMLADLQADLHAGDDSFFENVPSSYSVVRHQGRYYVIVNEEDKDKVLRQGGREHPVSQAMWN